MANVARSLRFASVLAFLTLSESRSTQAPSQAVTRFRAVEGYSLSITVTSNDDMKGSRLGESEQRKLKEKFVAKFDLKERHFDANGVEWLGEGIAEQELEEGRKEVYFGGNLVQEITSVGKGKSKTKAQLYIDELKKTFWVTVDTEYIPAKMSGYRKNFSDPTEQISGDTSLSTTGLRWLTETYPLPAAGLGLLVDKPYPKELCGDYLSDLDTARTHFEHAHLGRIQIDLTPLEANPPKLILTPPKNYSTWRPTPDLTNQPRPAVNVASINNPFNLTGFMLQIQVPNLLPMASQSLAFLQVQNRSGKKGEEELAVGPFDVDWEVVQPGKKSKILKVTFHLTEVSKFPGWCMNYPPTSAQAADEPDLVFVPPTSHADWILDRKLPELTIFGASAQTGKGTIRLRAQDGAAIGVLTAEAELEGRGPIHAEIKGSQSPGRLLIPDRDEGSEIARGWKAKFARNMGDNADEDDTPEGDGQKGDGLTVWEEYRGFRVGDKWTDCDPRKKDLFIENTIGADAQAGIDLFGKVTEIAIHDKLIPGQERSEDRVINFNKRKEGHPTDQHCLVLRANPGLEEDVAGQTEDASFFDAVLSRLGPPKNVEWVNISSKVVTRANKYPKSNYPKNLASTIAHELSHAVGIYHHGEGDLKVEWSVKEINGTPQIFEDGKLIHVFDETMAPLPVTGVYLFSDYPNGDKKYQITLGMPEGQNGGFEDCWMRYNTASTYPYRKQPNDARIWLKESQSKVGLTLCNSRDGVDFNSSAHKPHSRFGSAAQGHGDCIHQFVVSDRWQSKSR